MFFFFQAEDGIRDVAVTGVQTCALPICSRALEVQLKLAAHGRAQTVEKLAKSPAAKIVLYVARIEVIRDVKNGDSYPRAATLKPRNKTRYLEALNNLQVER